MSLTGKDELTTAAPITNDGFWSDTSMADLMNKYRIPSDVPDDTIKWGLSLAVIRVNEKLQAAKDVILSLPYATFEAYLTANSTPVAESELLQMHYEHAVYSRAKAFLLQQFATIRRKDSQEDSKESEQTEQFWLDESAKAIAAIMTVFFPTESFTGNSDVYVELL